MIECILNVLDKLPITEDVLSECQVARTLAIYATTKDLTPELVSQATKLLQKWQTVVYKLSYEYDQEGQHEMKQRDMRSRLDVLRALDRPGTETELDREDDLIKKTTNGFVLHK
jgi:hypothetical protein